MLQARKLVKLKEVVGESREGEEELEGEVVVGPSGEAVVYSSGNTPLFFPNKSFHELYYTLPLVGEFPSWIILLLHIPAHLAHRWVQWGRWGYSRDDKGTGARSCAELDGDGGPPSFAWGGVVGAVMWDIPLFSTFFSLCLHLSHSSCI